MKVYLLIAAIGKLWNYGKQICAFDDFIFTDKS